jgi:hypothetical protein
MTRELADILKQAEALPLDEQMVLIARLAEHNRRALRGDRPSRSWREARGIAPQSLFGEDAQAWVSRMRAEADDARRKGQS